MGSTSVCDKSRLPKAMLALETDFPDLRVEYHRVKNGFDLSMTDRAHLRIDCRDRVQKLIDIASREKTDGNIPDGTNLVHHYTCSLLWSLWTEMFGWRRPVLVLCIRRSWIYTYSKQRRNSSQLPSTITGHFENRRKSGKDDRFRAPPPHHRFSHPSAITVFAQPPWQNHPR
jgi:hypothetical protein